MTVSPTPLDSGQLDSTIRELLIGDPMPKGRRLLGVEYERLILHRETDASAPLALCRELLDRLGRRFNGEPMLDGDVVKGVTTTDFDLSIEPGGQLEVALPPFENLAAIDAAMAHVTAAIEAELLDLGNGDYRLIGLGHAPVTPVDDLELLPRPRYAVMDAKMPRRGPLSRNMMRATAGFQLTYDIVDEADAARKLALLFRLSPLLLALTANSRRIAGEDSGYASFRHRVWWETDLDRSGLPDGALYAETAIDGYIDYAKRAHVLFVQDPNGPGLIDPGDVTLAELTQQGSVSRDDVALHLTTLFPFVRLRQYIEVRCFDSVEWEDARSVLALVSGLVYCDNAFAAAWELSAQLLPNDEVSLRDLHFAAARDGLGALTPGRDRTLRDLAHQLVGFAKATLGGSSCDWARPEDLAAVADKVTTESV